MKIFIFAWLALSAGLAPAAALPAEPEMGKLLWSLNNTGQPWRMDQTVGKPGKKGADIHLLEAWKIADAAPDVTIALIDGGFDLSHPDLQGEVLAGKAYSYLTPDHKLEKVTESIQVHGNLVAGIIGANGENKIGITGISRHSRILPIEAIPDEGSETDANVAAAIRYAVDQGARVINCSFGKPTTSDVVKDAIAYAEEHNVFLVAGAGNDNKSIDTDGFWPASYSRTFDNVIAVAATDRDDHLWDGSSFGQTVEIAAPGSEIFSTGLNGTDPGIPVRVDYMTASGTSMAAPHVTGVVALMIEVNSQLKTSDIKRILMASVDVLPNLKGKVKTSGRLNSAKALEMAKAAAAPKPVVDTTANTSCNYDSAKKILAKTSKGYTAEWTMSDSPDLLAPLQTSETKYVDTIAWIRKNTNLDWKGILQNQIDVITKDLPAISDDAGRKEMQKMIDGDKLMLSGQGGDVHPIACLESVPYREYLKVIDLAKFPQEFDAMVYKKDGSVKILGDFYKMDAPAGEPTGVGDSKAKVTERQKLVSAGWTLYAHIHDHTFVFGGDDIGGEVAPSDPDVELYKTMKPQFAVITNGIDTVWMTQAQVSKF